MGIIFVVLGVHSKMNAPRNIFQNAILTDIFYVCFLLFKINENATVRLDIVSYIIPRKSSIKDSIDLNSRYRYIQKIIII